MVEELLEIGNYHRAGQVGVASTSLATTLSPARSAMRATLLGNIEASYAVTAVDTRRVEP